MSEEKEWTSIGITKERYAKATKLRAYFEYITGARLSLGELFSMTLGLFAGFMAPAKILFDKLEAGEISEEELAKMIGLTWIENFKELYNVRKTGETNWWDMLLDVGLKTLESFEKIIKNSRKQT